MALNRYMHPRNIYKIPPDFHKLAQQHPEFAAVSKLDVTGKVGIDFKDAKSLRILTKCLLKSDFNLDVDIPKDRLVPTLPLRLNYILWLEDLLTGIERNDNIKGLDIGTGACVIYPLLAATKNKWKMVATETDPDSCIKAEENIQTNNLKDLISLRKNTSKTIITHLFSEEDNDIFDFCMCNPPFYSNVEELCESRSPARLPPKNGFTGSPQELITEGGELEFCRTLIQESKAYKNKILIFTTMIGHKYNLSMLIQDLKIENIRHTHTEFCQGRVTRWGLAWTYQDYDLYRLLPPRDKPRKKHNPTIYLLPQLPNSIYNIDTAFNKIKELLNNLRISYKLINIRGNNLILDVKAHTNTWSNQRRKRRLQKIMASEVKKHKVDLCSEATTSETSGNSVATFRSSKSDDEDHKNCDSKQVCPNGNDQDEITHLNTKSTLHAFLKLLKKDNEILLELEFLDGSAGKEGLHQVMQYIKNNWK